MSGHRATEIVSPCFPDIHRYAPAVPSPPPRHDLVFRTHLPPPTHASARLELLGEITDWLTPLALRPTALPGTFESPLSLPTGVYTYKLRLDGAWILDPDNPRTRVVDGARNNLLCIGGADEPITFAPVPPFVVADPRGGVDVLAALRRGNGSALSVAWEEEGHPPAHDTPMHVLREEPEHLLFRAHLPISTQRCRLLFRLADGSRVGVAPSQEPFLVDTSSVQPLPGWWHDAVVYAIFVDRFRPARDRDDWRNSPGRDVHAGGHLEGIRRSLDALCAVGINTLYLTPIHVAASSHRYDTVDFLRVDPLLGGDDALRRLFDDAHAKKMRVLLDLSFAHVGRGFPPCESVLASGRNSPFAAWFLWRADRPDELRHYGRRTDAPLLDLDHSDVRRLVLDTVRAWASFEIDGFRLDATAQVPLELARAIRQQMRRARPEALVLGELVPPHAWRWRSEGALDAATEFGFHQAITQFIAERSIDAQAFWRRVVDSEIVRGGEAQTSIRFLSTHDHNRLATLARMQGDLARHPLGLLLLFSLPGTPMLLYGEELGMSSAIAEIEPESVWEDRAPMPWDWTGAERSTRALSSRIIHARNASRALRHGTCSAVYASGPLLVVRRAADGDVVDIAINASSETTELELDDDELDGIEVLATVGNVRVDRAVVSLGANAGLIARRTKSNAGAAVLRGRVEANRRAIDEAMTTRRLDGSAHPTRIDLSITERCNLRCVHCINASPQRTECGRARVMTPRVLDALRDDLAFASYVGFVHGGESLTSPMLWNVLDAIRTSRAGAPTTVHLLTNGMLLREETTRRLIAGGVTSISVSLDGASSATNDAIRLGARFDEIVSHVRDALRVRKELYSDLRVGLSLVVLRSNLHELRAFVELAATIGVDWIKLEELVPQGVPLELLPTDDAVAANVREAVRVASERGLVVVDHVSPPTVWRCRLDQEPDAARFLRADSFANRAAIHPCRAPWDRACIEPNGDVHVGDWHGPIAGNLTHEPLPQLWTGAVARSERTRSIAARVCDAGAVTCLPIDEGE